MSRYKGTKKFSNRSDYYRFLREKRNLKIANHYETPILKHPSVAERTRVISDTHIWKYGDRLYILADQYYGDSSFWWVIAWYNSVPTEVDLSFGDIIQIPINLESALNAIGIEY